MVAKGPAAPTQATAISTTTRPIAWAGMSTEVAAATAPASEDSHGSYAPSIFSSAVCDWKPRSVRST